MPQKDRKTVPDRVLTSVNELLALANMPSVALLYKTVRSKLINSEGASQRGAALVLCPDGICSGLFEKNHRINQRHSLYQRKNRDN